MRIAILNGFPFHYEMFGCIIEYCLERKIDFDIYTNLQEANHWFQWYSQHFQIEFTLHNHLSFTNDKKYDHVFLVTDDDNRTPSAIVDDRYLCYDHHITMRRPEITRHISVRPFTETTRNWALPLYSLFPKEKKEKTSLSPIVLCIGKNHILRSKGDIQRLQKLFVHFEDIQFIFINRELFLESLQKIYPNFSFAENICTKDMMEIIEKASHVFISDSTQDYIQDAISGAIPLALGGLCQLILPKSMNHYYNFSTAITYDNQSKLTLQLPSLDALEEERTRLLNQRNHVYDHFFSISISSSSSSEQRPSPPL